MRTFIDWHVRRLDAQGVRYCPGRGRPDSAVSVSGTIGLARVLLVCGNGLSPGKDCQ
jgi:hypothetical protein